MSDLKRFLDAQQRDYATALTEIKAGSKRSSGFLKFFGNPVCDDDVI
jgi:uncharacterized protein (DUF1810 family)